MNEYSMIADIREGDEFIGFYVLKRCELKEYDGSFRVEIELSDKTGSVPGVIWENAHQIRQQIEKGSIVKVHGCLLTYREMPQARIDKIRAKYGAGILVDAAMSLVRCHSTLSLVNR